MYCGRDFDPSDSGENELYQFDFVNDLAVGETITSSSWTCVVAPDSRVNDSAASTRLGGSVTIQGTKSIQRISNLQPGVRYRLQASVITNNGNTLSLFSHVLCQTPK